MSACPKCNKAARYYRIKKRTQYACSQCGHQIAPLKNTIFYRSHVPLTMWFYAIYLFSINKNGMSAKELERMLGVQYRTAYNMLNKIRALVAKENNGVYFESGTSEIDDAYLGGKTTNKYADEVKAMRKKAGHGITGGMRGQNKTVAIDAANREAGKAEAEVL